jgi:hypothetical protein
LRHCAGRLERRLLSTGAQTLICHPEPLTGVSSCYALAGYATLFAARLSGCPPSLARSSFLAAIAATPEGAAVFGTRAHKRGVCFYGFVAGTGAGTS